MFSGPVCAWSTFLIFRLIPSGSGIRLCAGPFGLSAHVSELKNIGPSGGILLSSPSFVFFGIINSGSFIRHSVASSTCHAAVAARWVLSLNSGAWLSCSFSSEHFCQLHFIPKCLSSNTCSMSSRVFSFFPCPSGLHEVVRSVLGPSVSLSPARASPRAASIALGC